MTSGVRCAGTGQLYSGKLESIILTVMCVELSSECGVERKGVVGEGGGSPSSPALHISPYLPITSSALIHDTAAAVDLSQS